MWIMVFFDLPTDTADNRRIYAKFRKRIMQDGFSMFQFSIYTRHCPSRENAAVHINRVKKILPEKGNIGILSITDKQFGEMEVYWGKSKVESPDISQQLEMF